MLFVPYSSMIEIMFWRMPVRIEATTIAAITPMTMPSTVRKLRNLFERTLSSAILSVSRGKIFGMRSFTLSRLGQGDNWIQPRRFERRIDARDHANHARYDQRQQNVTDRNRHRNFRQLGDERRHAPGC